MFSGRKVNIDNAVGNRLQLIDMSKKLLIVTKKTDPKIEIDYENQYLGTPNSIFKFVYDTHMRSIECVINTIHRHNIDYHIVESKSFVAEPENILAVITIGGDGTLLSASHNLNENIPILGVNSDPEHSVGFFCSANSTTFESYLNNIESNSLTILPLSRMSIKKNGKLICNRILNDILFCHINPATISKYTLQLMSSRSLTPVNLSSPKFNPLSSQEYQKSSGLWIGPAAGSTAARRSAGCTPLNLQSVNIQACVRELYCKPTDRNTGTRELIAKPGEFIKIVSQMDNGSMFLDGDYNIVPVGYNDELHFEKSSEHLSLL